MPKILLRDIRDLQNDDGIIYEQLLPALTFPQFEELQPDVYTIRPEVLSAAGVPFEVKDTRDDFNSAIATHRFVTIQDDDDNGNNSTLNFWNGSELLLLNTTPGRVPYAPAPPPTNGLVDDEANNFDWTFALGFTTPSDYEYNLLNAGWSQVTAKPIGVGNVAVAEGALQLRVRAFGTHTASAILTNAQPFTVGLDDLIWEPATGVTLSNFSKTATNTNANGETVNQTGTAATKKMSGFGAYVQFSMANSSYGLLNSLQIFPESKIAQSYYTDGAESQIDITAGEGKIKYNNVEYFLGANDLVKAEIIDGGSGAVYLVVFKSSDNGATWIELNGKNCETTMVVRCWLREQNNYVTNLKGAGLV